MTIICQQGHVMHPGEGRCPRCGSLPQADAMAAFDPKAAPPAVKTSPENENHSSSDINFWESDNFNPGGVQDAPDERDYRYDEIAGGQFGAAPFDWQKGADVESLLSSRLGQTNFRLTSNNQNGSGSCGGQAWSKYDAVQRSMVEGVPFVERSAKYIYSQVFAPGGGSGARALGGILTSQGCSTEVLCSSYDHGQPPSEAFMERVQDITPAARDDAPNAQSRSYASVPLDIDSLAQAIRDTYGVVIGIMGSNNGTWGSAFPQPPVAGQTKWYHWMYFGKAAIQKNNKAVAGLQSWGPGIGQNGWQWLDENYINSAAFAAWSLVFNPTPMPDSFSHLFEVDLAFGDNSGEVTFLQTALAKDGEFPASVPTSGLYGKITANAVLKFQQKYAVAPAEELQQLAGKKVGPATRAKLNELFAPKTN